ncbi:beta-glucoside-specific PTS transporter subunit IIABC [Enterococcus canintestini]|uniref:PTS system sucrose-specific EIIBCA component n=1 Tax=Enterococcus canintestini TaxID=317010 RepID=A0A267HU64_9ENTE|nr:beta-glucoside-specific PTS transporter subunit IIABC [Enterococcus canintestini]PAB01028.1 PTS beta-glucoside transporter subunit IIABC [Enterococcus canintestini]
MSKNYNDLADSIVTLVGGEQNINSLYHCITRLRFKLKDISIAQQNTSKIKELAGVLSVVEANNQYQVVIGNEVENVFNTIMARYNIKSALGSDNNDEITTNSEEEKEGNIFLRFFNTLSSIFNPIIMPLAGAGMIKALLVVLTTYNFMSAESSTYKILSATGNSVFYFLPLFLALSAARVFKANQFVALAIVAALLEPNFTALVTANGVTVDFLGLPAILMGYSGTVIPAIISIFVYSKLEKILKRFIPKSLEIFLLPMVALLIMVPLTVMVIGPVGVYLGDGLGSLINIISERSGLLAGLVIGGGWTLLVMIGIHWGVVPIMVNNLATYGYDIIRPMVAAATFASAGAALGVFFRTKSKETKSLALSSLVPALLGGITEPIVYGLSVKYKKPLIAQIIAGAIAGAFMGAMKTKAIVYVFPALTTLPAFFGETFPIYCIGIAMAFFLSAILTYILGLDEKIEEVKKEDEKLLSPVDGEVIQIESVKDPVFSTKAMGEGFAVIPKSNQIYAPISGVVETVFPTQHAIGIKGDNGLEVLVHIGINTVELNGKYFDISCVAGSRVTKGMIIGEVDFKALQAAGYDSTTMVVVTNGNELSEPVKFDIKEIHLAGGAV